MNDNTEALPPLPERDTSKPAEQQGLFRKFIVTRTDGSSEPGGKHEHCEYFVLDVDHDPHAAAALAAYADAVERTHPELAADMRQRYALAQRQQVPADVERIMFLADTMARRYAERDIPTGELYRGIAERHWQEARAELRAALTAAPSAQPRLTVRVQSFPESNGKRNWTALLVRVDPWGGLIGNCGGITIARGEFWNRVAYEAECARALLGERDTEPFILDYGDDITTPEQWAGEVRGGRPVRERNAAPSAQAEPVTRFCPSCGSVGPVPSQYRDCCPDGSNARVIPEKLAQQCHDLFQLAIRAPSDPDEVAAPPTAQAEPQVPLTEADVFHSDDIMAVNADAQLGMIVLMQLVRAIERAHGIGKQESK